MDNYDPEKDHQIAALNSIVQEYRTRIQQLKEENERLKDNQARLINDTHYNTTP